MPLIPAPPSRVLAIEARFRQLLTEYEPLQGIYDGAIRRMTPDTVDVAEGVVVALWTVDEDMEPETLCSTRVRARMFLTVSAAEPSEASNDEIGDIREQLNSITEAFRAAVWFFNQDPTPGEQLWYAVKFLINPTTQYERKVQESWKSTTQFDVYTQKADS